MNKLQERLYQYIAEVRFSALQMDEEFISARKVRDEAEKTLCDRLTEEQAYLLSQYMDEENYLSSLQLRHMFQETLTLIQNIFHFSL